VSRAPSTRVHIKARAARAVRSKEWKREKISALGDIEAGHECEKLPLCERLLNELNERAARE